MDGPHKRLRPRGGFRKAASFQTATLIYDATVWFCERFLDPRSRTVDQMVQAARSGRQNIAEGSWASASSSQTELRLVNVAAGKPRGAAARLRGLPAPSASAAMARRQS